MIKLTENSCDYRIASKPPMAGEPIITEIVTMIPKTMPTIRKRLFTNRVFQNPIKNRLSLDWGKIWKKALKQKLQL